MSQGLYIFGAYEKKDENVSTVDTSVHVFQKIYAAVFMCEEFEERAHTAMSICARITSTRIMLLESQPFAGIVV